MLTRQLISRGPVGRLLELLLTTWMHSVFAQPLQQQRRTKPLMPRFVKLRDQASKLRFARSRVATSRCLGSLLESHCLFPRRSTANTLTACFFLRKLIEVPFGVSGNAFLKVAESSLKGSVERCKFFSDVFDLSQWIARSPRLIAFSCSPHFATMGLGFPDRSSLYFVVGDYRLSLLVRSRFVFLSLPCNCCRDVIALCLRCCDCCRRRFCL